MPDEPIQTSTPVEDNPYAKFRKSNYTPPVNTEPETPAPTASASKPDRLTTGLELGGIGGLGAVGALAAMRFPALRASIARLASEHPTLTSGLVGGGAGGAAGKPG